MVYHRTSFNLRILCEGCMLHHKHLVRVCMDLEKQKQLWKRSADGVVGNREEVLHKLQHWACHVIQKRLYDKTTRAVFNISISDWFWTTVRVLQGCVLPSTLFNESWRRHGEITKAPSACDLLFADDIDGIEGKEEKLSDLVRRLDATPRPSSMEIIVEKTKRMANNTNGTRADTWINGQPFETVCSSGTWVSLSQTRAPNQKYCPEEHRSESNVLSDPPETVVLSTC